MVERERERERGMEGLTDEERRALRGSKFGSLPPSVSFPSRSKLKPSETPKKKLKWRETKQFNGIQVFHHPYHIILQILPSKNQSNIPENPIQLSPSPLFIDCQSATPLPFKKPHRFSFKHHVSSFLGCGFRTHEDDLPESPPCKWDETPRRDYNSSISSDSDDELFPLPPPSTRHPITTSISGDSDNELFPPPPPTTTPTRHPGYEREDEEEEIVTLAAFSLNRKKRVKKLLPSFPAEGKVKDSFAVVKESVDPYEDFKASMMQMILAKQLFEERDFEQLLECFLSLNSRHHYGVIVARSGHTVVRANSVLILFGGENAKRKKLSDLHMFDLKSLTWLPLHCTGQGPSPISNHVAALYGDKMLLIFGGASKSKTLNDIYSLDFETMIWSRIKIRGFHPSPRAGCCGVLRGTKWYIAGGGSRKKRHTEMLIFDVLKQEWSVSVASPPSSITTNKGFSLVLMQHKERDFLVVFGGSKKEPSNQIEVLTMEKNESSMGKDWKATTKAIQKVEKLKAPKGKDWKAITKAKQKVVLTITLPFNHYDGISTMALKFHHEEDSMMAKSSEDGSPSQVAEQRTKQLDMGVQANIAGNKANSEETSLFESDGSNTHNKGNENLPTDDDDIVHLSTVWNKNGCPNKKNEILEGQLAVALASREAAEKNLSSVLKSRQEMEKKLTDAVKEMELLKEKLAGVELAQEEANNVSNIVHSDNVRLEHDVAFLKVVLDDTKKELHSTRGVLAGERARALQPQVEVFHLKQRLQSVKNRAPTPRKSFHHDVFAGNGYVICRRLDVGSFEPAGFFLSCDQF
ncbi:unnamed protein product [Camellia sinensis]